MADAVVRNRLPLYLRSWSCSASFPALLASSSLNSLHLDKKLQTPSLVGTAGASFKFRPRKQIGFIKARGTAVDSEAPKWWEKDCGPNMIDIHSTQEFLTALSQAGDKLVIVEFYGTWCASCRALFPKLCRTVKEHSEILFLKVDFDANKPMCKSLNVKVLPYFHFYRGADGQLESFSCSLSKFQKIKDAIQQHGTDRCSIGPNKGVGDLSMELASS